MFAASRAAGSRSGQLVLCCMPAVSRIIASSTSRVWKQIASSMARTTCPRCVKAASTHSVDHGQNKVAGNMLRRHSVTLQVQCSMTNCGSRLVQQKSMLSTARAICYLGRASCVPVMPSSAPLASSSQCGASSPPKAGTKYTPPVSGTCRAAHEQSLTGALWAAPTACYTCNVCTQMPYQGRMGSTTYFAWSAVWSHCSASPMSPAHVTVYDTGSTP